METKGTVLDSEALMTCPLCNAQRWQSVYSAHLEREKLAHVVCEECGLVFQNPRPTSGSLANYYGDAYGSVLNRGEEGTGSGPTLQAIRNAEIKAERAISFLERYYSPPERASVLDIGSSAGVLLDRFKARGYATYGIEPNVPFAQYSREHGHIVEVDFFDVQSFCGIRFDLVTLIHVLEHVHEPVAFLAATKRKLQDEGILLIEVPNALKPNGPLVEFFQLPHLFTFSPETLHRALIMAGFKLVAMDDKYPHLRALARQERASVSNGLPVGDYRFVLQVIKRCRTRDRILRPLLTVRRWLGTVRWHFRTCKKGYKASNLPRADNG